MTLTATVEAPPREQVFSARSASGPLAVLVDLRDGLAMGPVWRAFAWDEIQNRYRRSTLGLAWIMISHLIFVGAISIFFGGFSTAGMAGFTIYVAVGFAVFTFIIGNFVDGCDVFRSSASWIKSTSMPYSIYIYKSIARSLFPFAVQLASSLVIMVALGWRPTWTALMAIPALAIFLLNAVWIQLFFGLLAARWRDISHLVSALTRVLFFTTPILWVYEERAGLVKRFADINPLTHFLSIFRAPLLNTEPSPVSWPIVIGWTIFGWVLACAAASVMRRRLPFWV